MSAPDTPAAGPSCPSCGQPVWPGDNFCESCSAELSPALLSGDQAKPGRQCPDCPDATISPEGYCENCGRKVPSGNDHVELALDIVAGVTDRGLRHPRNEDAMALASALAAGGPVALAVVCDGVSTSTNPDEASQAASQSAVQVLLTAVRSGGDLSDASVRAVKAAQQALDELADTANAQFNAPSATFVSAVVMAGMVTVCWLGDSRAYWIDADGPEASRQLTIDDSIAQELVARGVLSEAEALASPQGHVVTGWIGADAAEAKPHVATFEPEGPGAVLLCSDGLWNYQPDAAGLAGLSLPGAISDPLGTAVALVDFANKAGGGDNITAVLIPYPPGNRKREGDTSQLAVTDIGERPHEPD
ncbi:MAG TPA: PP2C family serine/threonine-protein phosphatase [Streptosporangiaceae bacterium]|nr:PP2C family serine/threonine-protein phosphatase [Streptosporangiaceae bacterium]